MLYLSGAGPKPATLSASRDTDVDAMSSSAPVKLSRRGFLQSALGVAAGSMVLGLGLPARQAQAQQAGSTVVALLEIRPDGTVRLLSPFIEGGQGIFTGMAQIVGEELDADPATFTVEALPAGAGFPAVTAGSGSVRNNFDKMRRLGASARAMLVLAAANELGVPASELGTEPGAVIHRASGQRRSYGDLATAAFDLPVPPPENVTLRDPANFRWIGRDQPRLDAYDKSTGRAQYGIDIRVDGMLQAAVQHAPRLGLTVSDIRNQAEIAALPGVHSVHALDGVVAVVAERWWTARQAVEMLTVDWGPFDTLPEGWREMPEDFSSSAFSDTLAEAAVTGRQKEGEVAGDASSTLGAAATVIEAEYRNQFLNHAQMEPPSALARWNDDGTLDMWLPNQAPDFYRGAVARSAGLEASQVNIHSPLIGGFFGRHFLYPSSNVFPQAIALARATGRPVKVIWSREEEFLRSPLRPMAAVRFRGALDDQGMPIAIEAVSATEGPREAVFGTGETADPSALEGLTGKVYAIPHRRIAQVHVQGPAMIAFWRSVGHSMNDFFYESFLDELAAAGGHDPFELRRTLLSGNARLLHLLDAVAELSGGWNRGPFKAEDGSTRARGVAMASPFGSEAAAIAEVSIRRSRVQVHEVWEVLDPGTVLNPALVRQQVRGAAALGLSQVLAEESAWEAGAPVARNYDMYNILRPEEMPNIHVGIVESGAQIGGVGEPPLPAVPAAVANAVAALTGQPARRIPLSRQSFEG